MVATSPASSACRCSTSKLSSMSCFGNPNIRSSESRESLHALKVPTSSSSGCRGGFVNLTIDKLKTALKRKEKKSQKDGRNDLFSFSRRSVGRKDELKLDNFSKKEFDTKKDGESFSFGNFLLEPKPSGQLLIGSSAELSNTESDYDDAAANFFKEETSRESPEIEDEKITDIEVIPPGTSKLYVTCDLKKQIDDELHDNSVADMLRNRCKSNSEMRLCNIHMNAFVIEDTENLGDVSQFLQNQVNLEQDLKSDNEGDVIKKIMVDETETRPNILCNEMNGTEQSLRSSGRETNGERKAKNSIKEPIYLKHSFIEPDPNNFGTGGRSGILEVPSDLSSEVSSLNQLVDNSVGAPFRGLTSSIGLDGRSGDKLDHLSDKSAKAEQAIVELKLRNDQAVFGLSKGAERDRNSKQEQAWKPLIEETDDKGEKYKEFPVKEPLDLVTENVMGAHQSESPEYGSTIHDFCLGIPYGCLFIGDSLLSFNATWRVSFLYYGVLLGGLLLASSISSLKTRSDGCFSRIQIKVQAAIALIICSQALLNLLKSHSCGNGVMFVISAIMVGFYGYVYNLDENK